MQKIDNLPLMVHEVEALDPDSDLAARVASEAELAEDTMESAADVTASVRSNVELTEQGKAARIQRIAVAGGQRVHNRLAGLRDLRTRHTAAEREMASAALEPLSDKSKAALRSDVRARLAELDDVQRELTVERAGREADSLILAAVRELPESLSMVAPKTIETAIETAGRKLKPKEASAADKLKAALYTIEANYNRTLRALEEAGGFPRGAFEDAEDVDALVEELDR